MASLNSTLTVRGPWSLATSRRFWEGFTPAALTAPPQSNDHALRTVFRVDTDWSVAYAEVTQDQQTATIALQGGGNLDDAAAQVARFLSLDVDATAWPMVGQRDGVIADAQRRLPGLRPCGFHSPYEAAAWSVLSQRVRITQAAKLRQEMVRTHGDDGAFPSPQRLRDLDLDLPGRKSEYLQAVAEAALEGRLDGATLGRAEPSQSIHDLQAIKGIGPFSAELIVLRGANIPDALPQNERRLDAEIKELYGTDRTVEQISGPWRPFRTWASVYLRALREERTHEIDGQG